MCIAAQKNTNHPMYCVMWNLIEKCLQHYLCLFSVLSKIDAFGSGSITTGACCDPKTSSLHQDQNS